TIHTKDKPGQLMHISSCIDDLQLKIRDVKVKENDDTTDTLVIEMEVYNHRALKNVIVLDAVKRIDGVLSVDVS
ncbi:MAG: magnesium transporter MgtC, partial [Selenomonadaceae bacterium]|nr:magnesium transporter MgtC [Selenomonadaceae bacterium]